MKRREPDADRAVLPAAAPELMRAETKQRDNPFGKDEINRQTIPAEKARFGPGLRTAGDIVTDTEQLPEQTAVQIREIPIGPCN